MLTIEESPSRISLEQPGRMVLRCDPKENGERVALRFAHEPNIRIGSIEATLLDGTPLAIRIAGQEGASIAELGYLDVPVRVAIIINAAVPLVDPKAHLEVAFGPDSLPERVSFALQGSARFIVDRARISVPQGIGAGDVFNVTVDLTNDGSAPAREVNLRVAVPPVAVFEPNEEAWYEVEGDRRWFVLDLGYVGVGERVVRTIPMKAIAVLPDALSLGFEGAITCDAGTFPLRATAVSLRSESKTTVTLSLIERRPYRFGDTVLGVVTARAKGTDMVNDVRVDLPDGPIAWAEREVLFPSVAPFERLTRLVTGKVVAQPWGVETRRILPVVSDPIKSEGCALELTGTARVRGDLRIAPADADGSHQVVVILTNHGDGIARSIFVDNVTVADGVRGVLDSLTVDGIPRRRADGSLDVDLGLEVAALGIGDRCEIAWRVRSQVAQVSDFSVRFIADEVVGILRASAVEFAGVEKTIPAGLAASVDDDEEEEEEDDLDALAAPAPASAKTQAQVAENAAPAPILHDDELAARRSSDVSRVDDSQTDGIGLRYSATSEALTAWGAWFDSTDRPEVGRLVLAARAFLPIGAEDMAIDALLTGIRAEAVAIADGRLEAYRVSGFFAASGYDFGTAPLRTALSSLMQRLGEAPSVDGLGLDLTLVRMIGCEDPTYKKSVRALQEGLVTVLEALESVEGLGEPASEALLEAIGGLPVTAGGPR